MAYAYKFDKQYYKSVAGVCEGFIWNNFADYIMSGLSEYIDYEGFVTKYLELEVIETDNAYIVLSESDIAELEKQYFG